MSHHMRATWIALGCVSLLLTACGPSATPTPTRLPPTEAPTAAASATPEEETEAPADEPTDDADTTAEPDEATEDADATGDAASGEGTTATISVSSTNLRAGPDRQAEALIQLVRGQTVTVLGETPNQTYFYVRAEDGTEGWVARQLVTLSDTFADPPDMTPAP